MLALALLPLLAQASLVRRDTIDHDKVQGFPETVPSGVSGNVYKAYQPYLKVDAGCVPFPAVDAEGNTRYATIHLHQTIPSNLYIAIYTNDTSGGLDTTGSANGDCESSTGQIYVRGGANITSDNSNSPYALMYSWYFPKDNPSQALGHRHDWEGVIIWISDSTSTTPENILAVCPSGHGGWDCSTDGYTLHDSDSAPLIKYYNVWPVNHQCGLTDVVGGQQPLVAWESMPEVSRAALEETDFGSGNVPFKEENWADNLAKATFDLVV